MVMGTCLCGEVAFEVDAFENTMHCHCSRCRKQHGSAFVTYASARREAFRWLKGEDRITRYESSPEVFRNSCATCGSTLPMVDDDWAHVPAGLLNDDCGLKPTGHVFVDSKLGGYTITDELPQFRPLPPEAEITPLEDLARERTQGVLSGSCLCGDVTFVIDGQPSMAMNCHCTRCRKSRGAAHGTNLFVEPAALRFLTGEDQLTHYHVPDAERFGTTFCNRCGSQMPSRWPNMQDVLVPAGVMDDDVDVTPRAHIFVGDKAPWFEITDELPQFETSPPR